MPRAHASCLSCRIFNTRKACPRFCETCIGNLSFFPAKECQPYPVVKFWSATFAGSLCCDLRTTTTRVSRNFYIYCCEVKYMDLTDLYWLLLWNDHQFGVLLYCSVRFQHGLFFYRPPAEPKVQIFLGLPCSSEHSQCNPVVSLLHRSEPRLCVRAKFCPWPGSKFQEVRCVGRPVL